MGFLREGGSWGEGTYGTFKNLGSLREEWGGELENVGLQTH